MLRRFDWKDAGVISSEREGAGFSGGKKKKRRLTLTAVSSNYQNVAPGLGFEPRQRDSESLVLPLHYPGINIPAELL